MDRVSHCLDRLGARRHRLQPVLDRAAADADRAARWQSDGGPARRGRRLSQHGRAARLGLRRVPVRHHRRLYWPGAHAGAQHRRLQPVHRLPGLRPDPGAARHLPLPRRPWHRRRGRGRDSPGGRGIRRAPPGQDPRRHDDRRRVRFDHRRPSLQSGRTLWLALRLLRRRRPGPAAACSSAAAWASRRISRPCASGARR